uniref:Uncharacterized protein n=1 Tax=Anguilla anguilla TaxID=7936 RepID=A0A0E9VJ85_ANGAN
MDSYVKEQYADSSSG